MKRRMTLVLFLMMSFISVITRADILPHMLIVPACLIKNSSQKFEILSTQNNFHLIKANENNINKLIEMKVSKRCGGFVNVTHDWQIRNKGVTSSQFLKQQLTVKVGPDKSTYGIKYPTQVNKLLPQINPYRMWADLTSLSAFPDRYYQTDNGLKAAQWIRDRIKFISNNRPDVSIYFVPTGIYKQPSVVAKLGSSNLPGIVIGAHMDTTSGIKPGADDDGTGSVTLFETARVLLNSGMQFKKPIYFIWYAAEEVGLVGSQYVVKYFREKNIPVSEVMQIDMTGYPDRTYPTALWLVDDNVNGPLNTYLELLIKTYVKQPIKHTVCGYGCSDHASWHRYGYSACMPFEASMRTYNPYIHTSQDTLEKLVLNHMLNFAKLSLAFAIELAEPITE